MMPQEGGDVTKSYKKTRTSALRPRVTLSMMNTYNVNMLHIHIPSFPLFDVKKVVNVMVNDDL